MNIGIKFKILNEYGNYLKLILNDVNSSNYIWKVNEDEVYIKDNKTNNGFLFPQDKETLTNREFFNIISQDLYYTVFVNIKLYEKDDEIIINNYEDFLNSSCILVLLITDNEFVEIYSKDKRILEIIYKNATENKFNDIVCITYDNLKRKKFSAFSD